jgi:hypothetical protein
MHIIQSKKEDGASFCVSLSTQAWIHTFSFASQDSTGFRCFSIVLGKQMSK